MPKSPWIWWAFAALGVFGFVMRDADKTVLGGAWPVIGGAVGGLTALVGERLRLGARLKEVGEEAARQRRSERRREVRDAYIDLIEKQRTPPPEHQRIELYEWVGGSLLRLIACSSGALQAKAQEVLGRLDFLKYFDEDSATIEDGARTAIAELAPMVASYEPGS